MMGATDGLAQASEQNVTISELRKQLEEMRSQMAALQNRITALEGDKAIPQTKSAEEPKPSPSKGLTFTPGGFLQSTALIRTRNENADIATSYSAAPLDGSSNA